MSATQGSGAVRFEPEVVYLHSVKELAAPLGVLCGFLTRQGREGSQAMQNASVSQVSVHCFPTTISVI